MEERNKRILIVGDDPNNIFLKNFLSKAGYTVDCHQTGLSIVESKYTLPDLFIIEKDLPTIDGIALTKFLKIHRATKRIPIILISSSDCEEKAKRSGVEEFIGKPFEPAFLMKAVRKHIHFRALQSVCS